MPRQENGERSRRRVPAGANSWRAVEGYSNCRPADLKKRLNGKVMSIVSHRHVCRGDRG